MHLRDCWKEDDPGLANRRAMLNQCLLALKQAALMLSSLSFSTQGKTYLKENFLIAVHGVVYCNDCGLWSAHMTKLRKQHQDGRRPGCSRSNFSQGLSCYRSIYGGDVLIPPDFDRAFLCRQFRMYLDFIERTQETSFERIPNVPPRDIGQHAGNAQGNAQADTASVLLPPSPTKPFASWSSSRTLFDAFSHGVEFIPTHTDHNKDFFLHELQSVTTPCKMQADVIDFAIDVYGSMALQYFSGSYSSMAKYLSSKCCDPSDYRDNNIMDASSRFIDRVHEQLLSVDSSLLIDATKTGKYDTKASAFRVNNALRQYFDDIEHHRDDEGDCIYVATDEDKDILFDRVRSLVENIDSHGGGIPKKLGRKSKAMESQYKCDFARFMLFS